MKRTAKVTFIIQDILEFPSAEPKLNIEIKMEPLKPIEGSKAQELGSYLLGCVDFWRNQESGTISNVEGTRY